MPRPNILFIMSDDHSASAISAYGSHLAAVSPTPNIDRIACGGVRLNNCFCTNSICTPSRASIITGLYSHRNKVFTLADSLDRDRPNVAKMLQNAGYQTALIGKWHLKSEPSGFDYYSVLPGQGKYVDPKFKISGLPWEEQNTVTFPGYVTDITTDLALKWLDERDSARPFCLMLHHKAPHGPWQYASRHQHLFDGLEIPEPDSLFEDKSHRSPAARDLGTDLRHLALRMKGEISFEKGQEWATGRLDVEGMNDEEIIRATYQRYLKDYLRTVAAIDENVGRVLDYLDASGLADDTVVVYTSDQGQFLGEHCYYDKRWMYEESLRMPFLVRYPREIQPGAVNNDIVLNVDFAPLFLDYADTEASADMQGRSFRSCLAGITPPDWRQSMYYRYWMHISMHENPAHYGIRTRKHKLIFFYGLPLDAAGAEPEPTTPGWEFYDLEHDPFELCNLYNDPAHAGTIEELREELWELKEELGDTDEKYPELMRLRECQEVSQIADVNGQ